jgi:hypothetical protein
VRIKKPIHTILQTSLLPTLKPIRRELIPHTLLETSTVSLLHPATATNRRVCGCLSQRRWREGNFVAEWLFGIPVLSLLGDVVWRLGQGFAVD